MILKELMLMEKHELSSSEVLAMAKKVVAAAEELAFDEAEETKKAVTGDVIHLYAKAIVKSLPEKIMIHVEDLIKKENT